MKGSQLTLFHPVEACVELEAFLACRLTDLSERRRSVILEMSDLISQVCRKHNISLYDPSRHTGSLSGKKFSDSEIYQISRERVLASDVLIHLTNYPDTDSGQILDFANNALLPMIIISKSDDTVSRMVTGIPSFKVHIRYEHPGELRELLDDCLEQINPIIKERKLAFSNSNTSFVGQRIRKLREQLGLSIEDVAANVEYLTVETLHQIEENADQQSNPSLLQLRQIAVLLKTTVADLVEPDMGSRVVAYLNDWLEGRQAARYPNITEKDSRKIMRRMLLRVIDTLEKD